MGRVVAAFSSHGNVNCVTDKRRWLWETFVTPTMGSPVANSSDPPLPREMPNLKAKNVPVRLLLGRTLCTTPSRHLISILLTAPRS
jgi:hypothetical protein